MSLTHTHTGNRVQCPTVTLTRRERTEELAGMPNWTCRIKPFWHSGEPGPLKHPPKVHTHVQIISLITLASFMI